jgi:hypothetical protein
MKDAGMPMPALISLMPALVSSMLALVSSMLMPSYDEHTRNLTEIPVFSNPGF